MATAVRVTIKVHQRVACKAGSGALVFPLMRQFLGLLLLAITLVSHGGFSGAIAHTEQVHSHEAGSSHHTPAAVEETLEISSVAADTSNSGEPAPHASAHSHVSIDLPESASPFASFFAQRSLLRPGETAPLIGSDAAPLTEPPLA